MDAGALHAAVAAICPIDGLAQVPPASPWPTVAASDGSLWRIDYQAAATAVQRAAARSLVAAYTGVDLAAYTSAAHAALRDGGVTIGGMRIKTDAESRGLIDGAYALSQAQPDTAIDFKAASGWVTVDNSTMQTMAVAVGKWVQACYSAYRQIDSKVADGTFTTTAQIDAAFAAVTLPG